MTQKLAASSRRDSRLGFSSANSGQRSHQTTSRRHAKENAHKRLSMMTMNECTVMFYFAWDEQLSPFTVSHIKTIKEAGYQEDTEVLVFRTLCYTFPVREHALSGSGAGKRQFSPDAARCPFKPGRFFVHSRYCILFRSTEIRKTISTKRSARQFEIAECF